MSENYYNDSTNTNTIPIIKVGEVISVVDATKSGRIKVSITGVDDLETDGTLIDCVPLLPKYLSTLPKVGECVFIFQYEYKVGTPTTSFKSKRFWIGPLITQPTKLSGEDYNDALSILPDGYKKLKDPDIETKLDLAPIKPVERKIKHVLSNSFGFGGTNGSMLLSKLYE